MNAVSGPLDRLARAARWRCAWITLAQLLPLVVVATAIAWRWHGPVPALAIASAGLAASAAWLLLRLRGMGPRWVARQLDARRPELEDSSALLLQPKQGLSRLQRIQRGRIDQRVAAIAPGELRAHWPLAATLLPVAALAVLVAVLAWPTALEPDVVEAGRPDAAARLDASGTRVIASRIRVAPPDYTDLPERMEHGLDATAPTGSGLAWTLRFEPEPESAALQWLDGGSLELQRRGRDWHGELRLEDSRLYRVVTSGGAQVEPRLHRLEALPDHPPRVSVLEPAQNVVYAEAGQAEWPLEFEARDDYGLGAAELVLTLAQGSGELVDFSEVRRPLEGRDMHAANEPPRRRYAVAIDLDAMGVGPGDDLVARLEVVDNRQPEAQHARSASVVLRWPPPTMGDASGFDGLMQRTMPAFFRSQRQIIIDAEALLAEREALDRPVFVARSNDIGADQQLLRLRYGQFMGEEAEGGEAGHDHDHGHEHDRGAPSSTSDAPASQPRARPVFNPLFADHAAHQDDPDDDEHDDHDHDHGPDHASQHEDSRPATGGFGTDADALVAQFGHLHDIPEAATLLDPGTRETLRGALRAMWASEGALRLGEPEAALPHAHEALELIQQVRQANRIHLARVGLELPPIDETRRLSGDLEGVTDREDPIQPAHAGEAVLATLWARLDRSIDDTRPTSSDPFGLDAALAWVVEHQDEVADPLGLAEAIDALQRDPDCAPCRQRVRAQLWPNLPHPAAGVVQRPTGGESGAHYLRSLGREEDR
ncbi:DUF4175 family protein [Alkalisalibacterium limincola]|uniref:DUF4175 domain-containing protein n=1 Tax=Alkalisalibacterium limincola TaxID=2699169 RepID=A0A5C8KS80_9GAMM|nr:DUF4175 family protein [Alkalisalibacterium limincola]TXK62107.1 DUF4175 domain-containing protein [Alkalisalibacterium limincola]